MSTGPPFARCPTEPPTNVLWSRAASCAAQAHKSRGLLIERSRRKLSSTAPRAPRISLSSHSTPVRASSSLDARSRSACACREFNRRSYQTMLAHALPGFVQEVSPLLIGISPRSYCLSLYRRLPLVTPGRVPACDAGGACRRGHRRPRACSLPPTPEQPLTPKGWGVLAC